MGEIEQFIRASAAARGIDPDIAVRVANSEGGVTEPARVGKFNTGYSWWAFQLHYAMAGSPGVTKPTVGMGEGFTKLTGWQPGDPRAWRDSVRYALNRAKASGWGAWYGAAHVGIGKWDGINRNHPWDASAERWDYEAGITPMVVTYNKAEPDILQNDSWSCSCTAARWAMRALGRQPAESWFEDTMLAEGVVSQQDGLLDATGAGLAAFLKRHYAEFGYDANHEPIISWDWAVHEGGQPDGSGHQYPVLLGGRGWGHWAAMKDFDPSTGRILLMNPAPAWMGTGHTLDEATFRALGPFSAVRVWHPDLFAAPAPAPPPPPPVPVPDLSKLRTNAEIRAALQELIGRIEP